VALNCRYGTQRTIMTRYDRVGKREEKKIISPCTSHAREAVLRPAVSEVLSGLSCVGVRENANDGAGAVGERGACAPRLLAH
jgi:hypothetical protein